MNNVRKIDENGSISTFRSRPTARTKFVRLAPDYCVFGSGKRSARALVTTPWPSILWTLADSGVIRLSYRSFIETSLSSSVQLS